MSIMKDIPPAMAQETAGYVSFEGASREKLFLALFAAEPKRRRETAALISEFDALVEQTSTRRGRPYVFNRVIATPVPKGRADWKKRSSSRNQK